MQRVGVIRMVARYPVKSMCGDAYASLPLTLQGFEEDRRFAFVQAESRSDFPWLTARQMPELVRWQTSVEKPGTPDVAVTVTTPAVVVPSAVPGVVTTAEAKVLALVPSP